MNNKEIVSSFFFEGYVNLNYQKVSQLMVDDYINHSPANARGNLQAIGIEKKNELFYLIINKSSFFINKNSF